MKTLNRFLIRLRNLVTGQRGDQRLREELEDHVAREAEANIQAGMSEEEARRRARMKLGAAEAIREQYHAEEGLPLLEYLAQDTRFSLRQMRRSLGFTLVVVLTMALGIAATTTIFTVMYSTLLRSLPYPQSERIVAIHDTRITGRSAGGLMTGPRFYDIAARNRSFSSLAFFYFNESTLIAGKKLPIYVGKGETQWRFPSRRRLFHASFKRQPSRSQCDSLHRSIISPRQSAPSYWRWLRSVRCGALWLPAPSSMHPSVLVLA